MILYTLKSIFILSILFGFYKLALENENLHQFKRFYLLASLWLALIGPLLAFDVQTDLLPVADAQLAPGIGQMLLPKPQTVLVQPTQTDRWPAVQPLFYWLVTLVLLIRMARNLFSLSRLIRAYPTLNQLGATLVLLRSDTLPHTFLHYLFVSRMDYEQRTIEPELFTHELTHIRQKHSLDILFIELAGCFFWFNPVLFFIRRAVRLNHEFLADASVNSQHQDIVRYQRLLLSKLRPTVPVFLTSTLTFQTTKQRFVMMTRHTSPTRALFTASMATALLFLITFASGIRSIAQVTPPTPQKSPTPAAKLLDANDPKSLEQHYSDKPVIT